MSALRTALEIARDEDVAGFPFPIPPMTDPMGKHWDQPNRFDIEIDGTHAMMSQAVFEKLAEYSCSYPTGVYPGKMWKCHVGAHAQPPWPKEKLYWQLRWFGTHPDPKFVSNHSRLILIV